MKDKSRKSNGQLVVEGLHHRERMKAIEVAGDVVEQFQIAIKTFSSGQVGDTISHTAPVILQDPKAIIPQIPELTEKQEAASRMSLLYALLDNSFQNSLDRFQFMLANADLEGQVDLLKEFATIDWEALSQPAYSANAGAMEKLRGFLYLVRQMHEVRAADLQELLVLTQVPQFTRMLTLAGGYGKVLLVAYQMFDENRKYLSCDNAENEEIVAKLDEIVLHFSEAEDRRLSSAQDVRAYTEQLQNAMELANLLADLGNRASEMVGRVNLDKLLTAAMNENTQQTLNAQVALAEEMSKSMHVLANNQTRQARVQRAVASLNLYVKCYIAFECILTMLQVYMLTASTAIQLATAKKMQATSLRVGKEFYRENIAPLEGVINNFVDSFQLPADGD